jgi:hypothetical protein
MARARLRKMCCINAILVRELIPQMRFMRVVIAWQEVSIARVVHWRWARARGA